MLLKFLLLHPSLTPIRLLQLPLAILIYCYFALSSAPVDLTLEYNDKLMHFVGNVLLFGSFWLAFMPRVNSLLLLVALVPFVGLIEWIQGFNPARTLDFIDFIANVCGLVCGWVLCLVLQKLVRA